MTQAAHPRPKRKAKEEDSNPLLRCSRTSPQPHPPSHPPPPTPCPPPLHPLPAAPRVLHSIHCGCHCRHGYCGRGLGRRGVERRAGYLPLPQGDVFDCECQAGALLRCALALQEEIALGAHSAGCLARPSPPLLLAMQRRHVLVSFDLHTSTLPPNPLQALSWVIAPVLAGLFAFVLFFLIRTLVRELFFEGSAPPCSPASVAGPCPAQQVGSCMRTHPVAERAARPARLTVCYPTPPRPSLLRCCATAMRTSAPSSCCPSSPASPSSWSPTCEWQTLL